MLAFVLSAGGVRGALQVGALQVLLEMGIVPDMVVGSSIGAVNAALIACDPSVSGGHRLGRMAEQITRKDVYPGNRLSMAWALIRKRDGLFSNENWRRFLTKHVPCTTFGEMTKARCYVTAVELQTGRLHVFGERPDDPVVEALVASTAQPPFHPPVWINGRAYIDGGTLGTLPLRVAVEKGATEIYALNIYSELPKSRHSTFLDVSSRAVGAMLRHHLERDVEHCTSYDGVWLRQIDLVYPEEMNALDFSKLDRMVALGREATRLALAEGPLRAPTPATWQEQLAARRTRLAASVSTLSAGVAEWGETLWRNRTA
ncbi:MAG TPA: patatin-like phospholipase family protein [Ardenticatenaceae bacterium]